MTLLFSSSLWELSLTWWHLFNLSSFFCLYLSFFSSLSNHHSSAQLILMLIGLDWKTSQSLQISLPILLIQVTWTLCIWCRNYLNVLRSARIPRNSLSKPERRPIHFEHRRGCLRWTRRSTLRFKYCPDSPKHRPDRLRRSRRPICRSRNRPGSSKCRDRSVVFRDSPLQF